MQSIYHGGSRQMILDTAMLARDNGRAYSGILL
jgi:hypothetical protein